MKTRIRTPLAFTLALATTLALPSALAQHDARTTNPYHGKHDPRALREDPTVAEGQLAPLLEGLGDHHRAVTTRSERAQLFFDQGLKLTYGFNHQEALRSFKEAARLDPECAMAYWGWALVLGPNLNLPMDPAVVPQAYDAMQRALERIDKASPVERDLIQALAKNYSADPNDDRAELDAAYAHAMEGVHRSYPGDADIATLYAAALMNTTPWNYWTGDGRPKGPTNKILAALEAAIALDPHHEGALHYYIHAVESVDAPRAEAAADALRGLAPGAGHLVHMPSHIYMQLGRYEDAFQDNRLAALADESYVVQCRSQDLYPLTYYPHNVHFIVWAAWMQGRYSAALEEAIKVARQVPADGHDNVWGLYDTFLSQPLYTKIRFGKWDEILREPPSETESFYLQGLGHFARGLAYAHTGQRKQARRELSALTKRAKDPAALEMPMGFTNAATLLGLATDVLSGEILARAGRFDEALGHLERAVRHEEAMLYNEPPDWYFPVRHTLGAVLLEAGRPDEAEVVYWQDLRKHRENGFALFGLWKALLAQEKHSEAADVHQRFRNAWSAADAQLTSSRY